jgi:hypothetical protein
MEPDRIAQLESLLYGDEMVTPRMPSPQAVYDLLSFGDSILVTDNGDGTFDVTGSYENVYMVEDGLFRVDNANAYDNGDGTFTLTST